MIRLTEDQRRAIRAAAYCAVAEALQGVDQKSSMVTSIYRQASEQAQIGAVQALMSCTGNEAVASKVGGLSRTTLRDRLRMLTLEDRK